MVIIQIIYFCTLFVHYFRVSASSGLIQSPTCATCAAVTIKESFFAYILEYRRKQPRKNSVYLCACLAQPPVRLLFFRTVSSQSFSTKGKCKALANPPA